jgi:uncharacterized membrane protein
MKKLYLKKFTDFFDSKIRSRTILGIFLICFLASTILSFIPAEEACGGTQTGCYAVNNSGYEETIGIKNSYLGLITFGTLIILTISQMKKPRKYKKKLMLLGIMGGSLFSIYYLYLQTFVIKAFCKYCLVIDLGILLSFLLIFLWRKK